MKTYKNFETNAIRTQTERSKREHSSPMFMTSSFIFNDAEHAKALFADEVEGDIYSRFSNPTVREFEEKMSILEETEDGFATASGMAAVYASFVALLKSGDHIVSSRAIFGSTHKVFTQILTKFNITSTYVDLNDFDAWENAIQDNTKMFFCESPSNPGLELADMKKIGEIAKKNNLLFNVDNCFATPYLQRPAYYGADLITHSATKFIDGQGRVVGGVVLGKKELISEIRTFCRSTGPSLSPFNAWVLSKSLETLSVRMEKHCDNALRLAKYLELHPEVESARYPFLPSHPQYELAKKQMRLGGGLVTFIVKGGYERGKTFLNNLKMFSHTANLGDTRTIATHPASTTHAKLTEKERQAVGIEPGLIRVSVGLEHIEDIIADIEQALDKSK